MNHTVISNDFSNKIETLEGWNPEWVKTLPELPRMLPYFIRKCDSTSRYFDSNYRSFIRKNCSKDLYSFIQSQTMEGKFEEYLDKLLNAGFDKLSHSEKIFLSSYVVHKPDTKNGKGVLHSKKNLDRLSQAGYPSHLLNEKFDPIKKTAYLLNLAKENPNKIPFDIKQRIKFPDGEGDMAQFLRNHITGTQVPVSKVFRKELQKIAPKWIKQLDEWKNSGTADQKKANARSQALEMFFEMAKIRPRVGLKGSCFNTLCITHKQSQWFKALAKSKPKQFLKLTKIAPWFFQKTKTHLQRDIFSKYDRHAAKKYDIIDYAQNSKNKFYRIGLSSKTKTFDDVVMKCVLTYCTTSRKKNGYDKKFHIDLIKIRPEVANLYPLD